MKIAKITLLSACAIVGFALAGHASATITYAEAYASVDGFPTDSHSITAGPGGAQTSAGQVIPSPVGDVFVSAEAASVPGALHAAGVARANLPTNAQLQALARWSDW